MHTYCQQNKFFNTLLWEDINCMECQRGICVLLFYKNWLHCSGKQAKTSGGHTAYSNLLAASTFAPYANRVGDSNILVLCLDIDLSWRIARTLHHLSQESGIYSIYTMICRYTWAAVISHNFFPYSNWYNLVDTSVSWMKVSTKPLAMTWH